MPCESSNCSPGPAGGFSAACCSVIDASVPSRSTRTAEASSPPGRPTGRSRHSRSSAISEPSMLDPTEAELTSWLADFPVRTSASPEAGRASKASGPASGERWPGLLARFDRDSCSWRTAQHSLFEGSASSSVTWPRSGMTVGGRCYMRPTVVPRIAANESGSSVTCPTPTASDGRKSGPASGHGDGTLSLPAYAARFPTPAASDWKGSSQPGQRRGQLTDPAIGAISPGGRLNPEWVEWLMGWPIGWTGLSPLATAKFLEWQRRHSPCSPPSSGLR